MSSNNKKISFFILSIAFLVVVSGCMTKNQNKEELGVTNNNQTQSQPQSQEHLKQATTSIDMENVATSSGDVASSSDDNINNSDWQIYRNEELGFEIEYPEEWKVASYEDKVAFITGIAESAEVINFMSNNEKIAFNDLKKQKIEQYKDIMDQPKDIVVGGEKAFLIPTHEFGIIRIFFIHNNFIFEINTGGRMINSGMLNGFRFVDDKNQSGDIASIMANIKYLSNGDIDKKDWSVYRNEEYGYEIKYPKGVLISFEIVNEMGTVGNPSLRLGGKLFSIGVYPNVEELSVREWLDSRYLDYSEGWAGYYQEKNINGVNATVASLDNRKSKIDIYKCLTEWTIFPHKEKIYTVAGEFCDADDDVVKLFREVVYSFRFINQ